MNKLVALVALATALCAAQSTSSIGGQVLNSADDEPVNGVVLVLTAAASASTPLKFVTETRGLFLFENLPPGRYVLLAESEGFARQVFGSRGNPLAGIALSLAPGQEMNDLQFNLIPGSTISGKTLDAAGDPVRKATVLALQPIYRRGSKEYVPLGSTASDENGEYRLANLSPGNYLLSASSRNGEGIATFYPNSANLANASAVTVDAGAAAAGKDIRLVKAVTFRVAGKLAEENAAAAIAWLTRKGAGATALVTRVAAPIDSDGSFVFPSVAPGTYVLTATEQDGVAPASAALSVTVTAKNVEGIVLKPQSSGELTGTTSMSAADVPLPNGVQVVLEAADTLMPRPPRAAVGDDGKFTLKNLAAGRYIVHVQMPDTLYVRSVRYRGLDVTENGFEFGGGVPAPLLISLSASGAVVEGRVRGADGFPMPGAVVALVPSLRRYSRYKETTTDQNGAFTIAGVAPGEYKIYAWDEIETGAYQNAEWLKQYELKGRAIVAKQDGHETMSLRAIQ
jgi:protocatechuate 3,4-dioxygenase beta subunit